MRRLRALLVLLLLAASIVACAVPGSGRSSAATATLAVFDVGQALAVGLVTPDGHALLYDAGNSREDAEAVILPFFRAHGIARLDYLVLSHPDQDHVGGMPAILEAIDIGTFVDPVLPSTNRAYLETLRLVRARRIEAVRAERGRTLALGTAVRATILWPERPLLAEPDGTVSDNDNSVVLRIEHGTVRILVPGDLEERGEAALVARERSGLQAAILVVGHHGSRTSSSEAFLEAVRPSVAVISVGRNNPYGHPHPETLQRLRAVGAQVYRTDLDGTILVQSDGTRWVLVIGQERS